MKWQNVRYKSTICCAWLAHCCGTVLLWLVPACHYHMLLLAMP